MIYLNNGSAFWQPLAACKWAERSTYRPVDATGMPVPIVVARRKCKIRRVRIVVDGGTRLAWRYVAVPTEEDDNG